VQDFEDSKIFSGSLKFDPAHLKMTIYAIFKSTSNDAEIP